MQGNRNEREELRVIGGALFFRLVQGAAHDRAGSIPAADGVKRFVEFLMLFRAREK